MITQFLYNLGKDFNILSWIYLLIEWAVEVEGNLKTQIKSLFVFLSMNFSKAKEFTGCTTLNGCHKWKDVVRYHIVNYKNKGNLLTKWIKGID